MGSFASLFPDEHEVDYTHHAAGNGGNFDQGGRPAATMQVSRDMVPVDPGGYGFSIRGGCAGPANLITLYALRDPMARRIGLRPSIGHSGVRRSFAGGLPRDRELQG